MTDYPKWLPADAAVLTAYISIPLPAKVVRALADKTGRTVEGVRSKMLSMRRQAGVQLNLPRAVLSPERIASIQARAAAGETVSSICRATGISRRRIENLTKVPTASIVPVVVAPVRPQTRSWDPLPAGHPLTWGLITQGTLLEGLGYATG